MAGDKTYITDSQGKQHRATRVHAVTPTDIVWSSNPNDYSVQVKIGGKWHRAILTMDAGASTFFENVNIDKALVVGSDGKNHTALIVKPESTATLSDIKTDEHALVSGTTTGETAVVTYSENWADVKYQDNVNVYKVLVTGSDGKTHTALLTTASGGSGGVQVIVLGIALLSLPDAIANSLSYVKAYGGTKQGLPGGYAPLEYIEMTGAQYLDTGITGYANTNVLKTKINASQVSATCFITFQNPTSGADNLGLFSSSRWYFQYGAPTRLSILASANTDVSIEATNGILKINGVSVTGTAATEFSISEPILIGAAINDTTVDSRMFQGKIYYFRWEDSNGNVLFDGVPAKDSNNVAGMYDTVSGRFLTNQGSGSITAGPEVVPTPDAPMDIVSNNGVLKVNSQGQIYTDGTTETIWAHGKNLWDGKMYFGRLSKSRPYIANYTEITSPFVSTGAYSGVGLVVKVIPGQQYCFSSDITNAEFKYVGFYANMEDVTDYTKVISFASATTGTAPAGANYAVFCFANTVLGTEFSWTWAQAELGSTPTDYEPPYDGGTATAEMLLSIGDYTDVQEILSGDVTRKVGVVVLDGTEKINTSSNVGSRHRYTIRLPNLSSGPQNVSYSTHFVGGKTIAELNIDSSLNNATTVYTSLVWLYTSTFSTADALKQFLADQYAAGTPVIIVYPLATATTESVAGQTLQVQAGDNTLEFTQASLSGLELEAEYTKVS